MIIQAKVGAPTTTTSLAQGQIIEPRLGNMGEQIASELHGIYYEATYRRTVFHAAIAAQVTSVGLTATHTGLVLSNPVGSPVNLVVLKVGMGFTVVFPAVSALGLGIGYNASTNVTHSSAVTVRSSFVGVGASGIGLVDSSSVMPTAPTLHTILGAGLTGAATTTPVAFSLYDIEGSIILPPGAYLCTYTSTVCGTAAGHFSFSWEEVPI
jgi:uncharacterized protein YjdB